MNNRVESIYDFYQLITKAAVKVRAIADQYMKLIDVEAAARDYMEVRGACTNLPEDWSGVGTSMCDRPDCFYCRLQRNVYAAGDIMTETFQQPSLQDRIDDARESAVEDALVEVCNAVRTTPPSDITPAKAAMAVACETKLMVATKLKALSEDLPEGDETRNILNSVAQGLWREGVAGVGGVTS